MKHTFFMLFVSIAISFMACEGGGENDENLPADNGNTEKPKDDETQEPVVCSITPIGELNQGTSIINSHADVTKRSSLMMNYRTLVTMEDSYPRYPRIKKMKMATIFCSITMAVLTVILVGVVFMRSVRI